MELKMEVIGVAAQLANGKDVLCDYLVGKLNDRLLGNGNWNFLPQNQREIQPWKRGAFANAVKEVYETSFGVNREFTEAWKRNPEPPPGMLMNVRKSLQFIGDGFRQIKSDIWIDIALRDENKKLIISDSRYINEAKAVKAKGGLMIILYRPGFLNDDPNPSESQLRPLVEWCINNLDEGPIRNRKFMPKDMPEILSYYDYFLVNDGSIDDLYNKIDNKLIPFIEAYYGNP